MARFITFFAVFAATVAAVYAAPPVGGATSITTYINSAIAKKKSPFGYDSVGSSAGIAGYLNGLYAVGTSDNPLVSAQYAQALSVYGKVYTVPLLFSAYSFFTLKAKNLRLTGKVLAKIYLGKTKTWSKVKKGLTGIIVPVARADGSGTTGVITYYLSTTTHGMFPYIGNGPLSAALLGRINGATQFGTGTDGVLAIVKSNPNAIAYAQTGAGIAATGPASEALLKNIAGKFVNSQTANLEQSIPSSLPAPSGDWSAVHLVDQPGAQTYPVTSFEYSFFRASYGGAFGNIPAIKKLFTYILSTAGQKLAGREQFAALPTGIAKGYSKTVKSVKA